MDGGNMNLQQELYRLVDPNQYSTKADAEKVMETVERTVKREGEKHFREHMKRLGVIAFKVHHVNYYGKEHLDELVSGKGYMERFKKGAYSLRIYEDYEEEPIVNVLIHGKTIVGKGSKHYRSLIQELVDEVETNRVKYPIQL